MKEFLNQRWGDLIGLLLIYTGIAVMFLTALYSLDSNLADVAGKGLVGAGLMALKLQSGVSKNG